MRVFGRGQTLGRGYRHMVVLTVVAISVAAVPSAWGDAPVNDNYADATVIGTLPFSDTVDLTDATNEPGEPTICYQGTKSTWYAFTPNTDEQITVSHAYSSFGGAVGVYAVDGSGLGGLDAVACAAPFSPSATFPVASGVTYAVQASDASANFGSPALGTLALTVEVYQPPPPPPNDDLADATPITGLPFDGTSDLTNATTEPGEPFATPNHDCGTSAKTVWYSFTPTRDEAIDLDTTASPGASVTVWREDSPGLAGLTGIDCGPSVVAAVTAGTTYALQLVDVFGGLGFADLGVQTVAPPANDDFASAAPLDGSLPFSASSDNSGATIQTGEPTPTCAEGPIARSVWWAYTPATDAFVNTFGGGSVIAIYAGRTLSGLTQTACATVGHAIFWKARAGRTYWLQVSGSPADLLGSPVSLTIEDDAGIGPSFSWTDSPSTVGLTTFFENPDPAGETSEHWDFGDGSTGSGTNPSHRFKADGSYVVTLKTHTTDGRTDVVSNTIEVVTHDISVVSISAPARIRVGETVMISARILSRDYAEPNVTVFASEIPTNGAAQFGDATQDVELDPRGTTFTFPFTATAADLAQKHITFQIEAHLFFERDSRPADNILVSRPATTVVHS